MAHAVSGPQGPPPLGPDGFDWTLWNADPVVVTGLVLLGAAYVTLALRHHRNHPVEGIERVKALSFFAGLAVLFGSLTGPVHDLSDYYLFSAHMVQHLLLAFAMPPLLLYGTPGWMLSRCCAIRACCASGASSPARPRPSPSSTWCSWRGTCRRPTTSR